MTRKNVIVDWERDKRCQVCKKYGTKGNMGLAQHMAMKDNLNPDRVHYRWREVELNHPYCVSMPEVMNLTDEILRKSYVRKKRK
jgi:hypothetical protein